MVQKKGIVLFVVYFIFKIISVVTSPGVQHNKENIRQKMYMDIYYSRWGGKLDSQKNSEIENMLVQIQNAQNKYDDMMSKKVNGELLQEEYVFARHDLFFSQRFGAFVLGLGVLVGHVCAFHRVSTLYFVRG